MFCRIQNYKQLENPNAKEIIAIVKEVNWIKQDRSFKVLPPSMPSHVTLLNDLPLPKIIVAEDLGHAEFLSIRATKMKTRFVHAIKRIKSGICSLQIPNTCIVIK